MGPKLRERIPYALLLGASSALVFWQLGATGFIHSDESIHSISAVQILRTGRWAVPAVDGDALFLKAPLATWPLAASFAAFGISEWSARLFAAACAVLAAMTTAVLAGRAFGSAWIGALAGLILVSNPGFLYIHCARFGEPDAPAIFFFCLSLMLFWRACEVASGRLLALSAAVAGLAAMAKSLAIGLLPLATMGLCLPFAAGLGRFRLRQWGWAALAFAAVALPWHALAYARYGQGFVDTYLFNQTIARMDAGAEPAFEWGWSWLQVPVAFHAFAPLAALGALFLFAGGDARQRRAAWRYLSWVAVVGGAVAAVETRLAWYVLPAYPALAS
ncbi:MAG TPA: glycosyltransferase family 39 protein, partial [Myxococcota bacterium]